MKERSYRVILDGTVAEGYDRDRVIDKLSEAFKKDRRMVQRLMAAAPRSIRGGLDLATARKYQTILQKMGAVSYVEAEPIESDPRGPEEKSHSPQREPLSAKSVSLPPREGVTPPIQTVQEQTKPLPEPSSHAQPLVERVAICPKCGYAPNSDTDVLLVRGDCPRCGLRVRKDVAIEEEDTQEAAYSRMKVRPELIYRDRTPASWNRRSTAALYTFGLFLAVHAALVLLWIFLFVPVDAIPLHAGTLFLQAALLDWPGLLVSSAIFLVSFVIPIFNRGLSSGQRLAGIEVLYMEETKMGGFYMSLALRTMVAGAVTLGPGWMTIWVVSQVGWFPSVWTNVVVMIVGGVLGWVCSAVSCYMRQDRRSLADLAAGTLQVEDAPMPRDVSRKAWLLILIAVGSWILLAGIIPLVTRLLGW